MGIQFSPPAAFTPLASKSMLKINCRSLGCKEWVLGLMTLTSRPPATINPYSRPSHLTLSIVLLITCRWDLRILRHSSADRSAGGDPRVKVSARAERRDSVPCKGRRRSVEGLFENRWVKVGRVSVERICMYNASSCTRSCVSLSPSLLIATKCRGPRDMTTTLEDPAVKLLRWSCTPS